MARSAVLVGINDYGGEGNLQGCVNDVTNMRHILKTYYGFTNSEIRVLVDRRATKENIIKRLEKMVSGAKRGDHLVFHYSGHGSQIRDRDEQDELNDYMDELICPHDMDWDGNFITDDQLRLIFSQLPASVTLEVFLDCCHSGTGLRTFDFGRPAELGPQHPTHARFLTPPIDIDCRLEGEVDDIQGIRRFRDEGVKNRVLWAGCQDDQTSADAYIDGSYNGAFTYYFCKHLRDTGGTIPRADLLKRLRASLRHEEYTQIPQLECDRTSREGHPLTVASTGTQRRSTKKT
jgi:metacaspase-1